MRATDHEYYVVKFRNNPQGTSILANELLASNLASLIGLPTAKAVVVDLDNELISRSDSLMRQVNDWPFGLAQSGMHLGSRYAINPLKGHTYDFLPKSHLRTVRNLSDFWGIYLFDCWTHNLDSRQAIYWKSGRQRRFSACFIDNGHCFGGNEWIIPTEMNAYPLPAHPAFGVLKFQSNLVNEWLSRIERISTTSIWRCAKQIPKEWYGARLRSLKGMIETLINRQRQLRSVMEPLTDASFCLEHRRTNRNRIGALIECRDDAEVVGVAIA